MVTKKTKKKLVGRGGSGRGQGRKRLAGDDIKVTVSVRLFPHDVEWLKLQGSISALVNQAVQEFRERSSFVGDGIDTPPGLKIQLRLDGGQDLVDNQGVFVKRNNNSTIGKVLFDYARSLRLEGLPPALYSALVKSKAEEFRSGQYGDFGLPENLRRAIAKRNLSHSS